MARRNVEAFAAAGYAPVRRGELSATLARDGRPTLHLELVPTGGRVFGGAFALEVSTAGPVLPRSGGVRARGRGVVRMQGVSFSPRPDDEAGRVVARGLEADSGLQRALGRVHFEEVRVEPDGRAVIRHLGGSLVWLLVPPMARPVPIGDGQVRATVDALRAFAKIGRSLALLAAVS